jgi:hypothetical protein
MSGSNAVAYKKALIDGLAAASALAAVQVSYHFPGNNSERELIHAGRVEGTQSYPVSRGGAGRFPRDEELTVKLHIVVTRPGADPYEVEARCIEIGKVVEELIAGDPDLTGLTGIIYSGITAVDLDSDSDDDGSIAVLTYDVFFKSRLT